MTFDALVSSVEAVAAALQRLDPTPGSHVGICAKNTREHLLALLATFAAGKVWIPLNPRNGRAELDAMIAVARPAVMIADESCLDRFTPIGVPLVITSGCPLRAYCVCAIWATFFSIVSGMCTPG